MADFGILRFGWCEYLPLTTTSVNLFLDWAIDEIKSG